MVINLGCVVMCLGGWLWVWEVFYIGIEIVVVG